MATDTRPIVGLMLGDVTGIGAEIAVKMLATQDVQKLSCAGIPDAHAPVRGSRGQ